MSNKTYLYFKTVWIYSLFITLIFEIYQWSIFHICRISKTFYRFSTEVSYILKGYKILIFAKERHLMQNIEEIKLLRHAWYFVYWNITSIEYYNIFILLKLIRLSQHTDGKIIQHSSYVASCTCFMTYFSKSLLPKLLNWLL